MKNITDESFKKYGRILNLDTTEFVETMLKKDSIPEGTASSSFLSAIVYLHYLVSL